MGEVTQKQLSSKKKKKRGRTRLKFRKKELGVRQTQMVNREGERFREIAVIFSVGKRKGGRVREGKGGVGETSSHYKAKSIPRIGSSDTLPPSGKKGRDKEVVRRDGWRSCQLNRKKTHSGEGAAKYRILWGSKEGGKIQPAEEGKRAWRNERRGRDIQADQFR